MKTAVLLLAIALGLGRIYIGYTVEPEHSTWVDFSKTAAHLLCGGLAVAWWYGRRMNQDAWYIWFAVQPWQGHVLLALSVLEVVVAVLSRVL